MSLLYTAFEYTLLAGATAWAAHHTFSRVLPLRRGLAAVLHHAARQPGLGRFGQLAGRGAARLAPPAAAGCASGCGGCGGGSGDRCAPPPPSGIIQLRAEASPAPDVKISSR